MSGSRCLAARVRAPADSFTSVQVPRDVTEEQLRPLFEPYGDIEHINILRTHRGQSAGELERCPCIVKDRRYIARDMQQLITIPVVCFPCMLDVCCGEVLRPKSCLDARHLFIWRRTHSTHEVLGLSTPPVCKTSGAVCAGIEFSRVICGTYAYTQHLRCSWCWAAEVLRLENLARVCD